jgi:hypothetical protein
MTAADKRACHETSGAELQSRIIRREADVIRTLSIHDPSIEVFLPPPEKATRAAVVVVPGGGHRLLVYKAEGQEPAEFLNGLGVAALR